MPTTAEELFLNGTAHFAGPPKTSFRIAHMHAMTNRGYGHYALALHYLHGIGCQSNFPKALAHLHAASYCGHASASYSLFLLYKPVSYSLAMESLETAWEQGHHHAARELATLTPPPPYQRDLLVHLEKVGLRAS